MAKKKEGVPNRSIYCRISFLHQAATYLALPKQQPREGSRCADPVSNEVQPSQPHVPLTGMARRLAADIRDISLKSRVRVSPAMKQTMCKNCDTVQIEGQSCSLYVENKSKGGKKPWADMLVRKCHTCGKEKRYPVNAPRTKRKTLRGSGGAKEEDKTVKANKAA